MTGALVGGPAVTWEPVKGMKNQCDVFTILVTIMTVVFCNALDIHVPQPGRHRSGLGQKLQRQASDKQ